MVEEAYFTMIYNIIVALMYYRKPSVYLCCFIKQFTDMIIPCTSKFVINLSIF